MEGCCYAIHTRAIFFAKLARSSHLATVDGMNSFFRVFLLGLALSMMGVIATPVFAQQPTVVDIVFPTERTVTFVDDFGDARSRHTHEGNDLIGKKMMPLYAAIDGRVSDVVIPQAAWGYAITLSDDAGYTYHYIHVNNDRPGTDDGNGGIEHAYAPGIRRGVEVKKGQLIGWMGDSGNAESVGAHLHFEIRRSNGTAINPYASLIAARDVGRYVPASITASVPDINTDKALVATTETANCVSGSLIKSVSSTAVYYCGADSKRYGFPNERIYFSWYADFKRVLTISNQGLATIPLGGNVTYRPGVRLVKIQSIPRVYAVDSGAVLRWIESPTVAASLYGSAWNKKVDDIPDTLFINYRIGESIKS